MTWLRGQDVSIQAKFESNLSMSIEPQPGYRVMPIDFIASPLHVRCLAACAALEIDTQDADTEKADQHTL